MSDEDRERRRREIQEATRDHNERAAERRAKAVAEAREVLLGPGAPDLPSALDLPAAHETRGEFVDPFPWLRGLVSAPRERIDEFAARFVRRRQV